MADKSRSNRKDAHAKRQRISLALSQVPTLSLKDPNGIDVSKSQKTEIAKEVHDQLPSSSQTISHSYPLTLPQAISYDQLPTHIPMLQDQGLISPQNVSTPEALSISVPSISLVEFDNTLSMPSSLATSQPDQDMHSLPDQEVDSSPDQDVDNSDYFSEDDDSIHDRSSGEESNEDEENHISCNAKHHELYTLFVENAVPRRVADKLLKTIRTMNEYDIRTLPSHMRSLAKENREILKDIIIHDRTQFIYFGIEKQLNKYPYLINMENDVIRISVGIDGLPLAKSSQAQFWPILGSITDRRVFMIALYFGYTKPKNSDEFLFPFVNEMKHLSNNGLVICSKRFTILFHRLSCDAPAKSFVLNTKGHTGYDSCSKCITHGEYIQNKVVFCETDAPLRGIENFEGHTILTDIPSFNVISSVPLDYMHLVCLGVMRTLLLYYMQKLSKDSITTISKRLQDIKPFVPSNFQRKPRPLSELSQWKATELRMFLLYTGPVVLRDKLPDEWYLNFILLHVGIRLLTDCEIDVSARTNSSKKIILDFLEGVITLYGRNLVTHNFHGLLHLPDDASIYGNIDEFSCFEFENFLFKLKKMVKHFKEPLKECIKRYSVIIPELYNSSSCYTPKVSKEIDSHEVIIQQQTFKKYNHVDYNAISLRCETNSDNHIFLTSGRIMKVAYVAANDSDEVYLVGNLYENSTDFYTHGTRSSSIGYIKVNALSRNRVAYPITSVKRKCFYFECMNMCIAVQMNHDL